MTNAEMHAIQVQDTPVLQERTIAPGFKLVGERLVEATNGASTGSDSQQRLGHFSHFVSARPSDKHPRRVLRQCAAHSDRSVQTSGCGIGLPDLGGPGYLRADPSTSPDHE